MPFFNELSFAPLKKTGVVYCSLQVLCMLGILTPFPGKCVAYIFCHLSFDFVYGLLCHAEK